MQSSKPSIIPMDNPTDGTLSGVTPPVPCLLLIRSHPLIL
nr:unnamed protein product [Callosobruchus analis]